MANEPSPAATAELDPVPPPLEKPTDDDDDDDDSVDAGLVANLAATRADSQAACSALFRPEKELPRTRRSASYGRAASKRDWERSRMVAVVVAGLLAAVAEVEVLVTVLGGDNLGAAGRGREEVSLGF